LTRQTGKRYLGQIAGHNDKTRIAQESRDLLYVENVAGKFPTPTGMTRIHLLDVLQCRS